LSDEAHANYLVRVRALVAERWRPYFAYCGVILVIDLFRNWAVLADAGMLASDAVFSWRGLHPVGYVLGMALPMFAALVGSEALGLRGARHALATLVSLALGIATGLGAMMALQGGMLNRVAVIEGVIVSDAAFIAREAWLYFTSGTLLAIYFASREREAAFTRLAQGAELERVRAERSTLASRLKVLQARVEPELLFGVLGEVRRLYEHDPVAADALLDDLIGYLRAALPQLRGEASTLGREVALAAAYLRLSPAGRSGRLEVEVRVDPAALPLAFPPMVLLPLAHGVAGRSAARVTLATVGADGVPPCGIALRVDAAAQPVRWGNDTLASLRSTLAQYFGAHAALEVGDDGAVVRWGGAPVSPAAA
jgi:hypothetical protein